MNDKEELTSLGLVDAKVKAAKKSKDTQKVWYILVDAEGDCSVSDKADKSAYAAYKNGNEIALSSDLATETNEPKAKKSKKDSKENKVEAPAKSTESSSTKTLNKKEMSTKTSAKKATKKSAKPAAKKVAAKVTGPIEIKADSIAAAVKTAIANKTKKALVTVKGKTYGLRNSTGWAVVRSILELGKDGFIMVVQGQGYYVYNKADYKTLFAKIFASSTYKNIGIYSQSTLPLWHEEHFNPFKK